MRKKQFKTRWFVLLCLLLVSSFAFAQTISVSGTVVDETGEPLLGVSITEVGTTNGTISANEGKFTLRVQNGGSILFSFIGFEPQTVKVDGRKEINVTLLESSNTLEEVVVTGYLPTKRKDVLGAVSSLKAEEIVQVTPVSAFDAIQGRTAGVQIATNGGPGAGFDIQIRGLSTFSGGGGPLFVVDGQQLDDINNLDPNDFASIEILKDASTAAIYGSRAANGVVLITTKSGKIGKPSLEISQTFTFQELQSGVPLANTAERIKYEQARSRQDLTGSFPDSLNVLYFISNDLQKLLMRTGQRSLTNVTLSGGSGGSKYFWNTGFLNHQGVVINSRYQRLNTTLRLDNDITKNIKASTRLTLTNEDRGGLNENTVFQQMVERIPYYPLFEPDGSYTVEIAGRQNPVAEAELTRRDVRNYRAQIFNSLEVKLFDGLSYRGNVGANFRLERQNNFDPSLVQTVGRPATGSENIGIDTDYQIENLLYYKNTFGKSHNVNAVGGYTFQKWNESTSSLSAIAFVSDNIETFNNVAELNTAQTNTSAAARALSGLFGNVQYDYKGKYLFSGVLRRDGSSRFGANKRYGVFPSVSLGWRVSDESFMNGLDKYVSNLMLRAGFGSVGNDRIGNYSAQLLYQPGNFYNGINGVAPFQLGNPDLGWESTNTTNFAIDAAFLNGKIETSVDLWTKTTTDLLYRVPIPAETGFRNIFQNIGGIRNNGIDLAIGGMVYKNKNFSWRTDFNITFINNVVTELADADGFESGNANQITFLVQEGQPLGNMLLYVNNGVFQYNESNAFDDNGNQLTPIFGDDGKFQKYQLNGSDYTGNVNQIRLASGNRLLGGGDIWWRDLNGDFIIDAENDRAIMGNGLAKRFGGWNNTFKYKGLSVSLLFDFSFGADIFRRYDQLRNDLNSANETPSPERINNAWLNPGDIAEFASLDRNRVQNRLPNSAYVDNADFIKLRNVRVNYSLPKSIVSKTKIFSNLTFTGSVNGWLTWTNYTGFNPELGTRGNALQPGLDALRYPAYREYLIGLNAKF